MAVKQSPKSYRFALVINKQNRYPGDLREIETK